MKRSTALRLAAAMFLLAALIQGPVPGQAQPDICQSCIIGGVCQPCEDGGGRPCVVETCCGVTRVISCGTCVLHCVPPPS